MIKIRLQGWSDVAVGTASALPATIMIAGVDLDLIYKVIVTLAAFIGLCLSLLGLIEKIHKFVSKKNRWK